MRRELDAAGLHYGIRFTAQGAPYASFGMAGETAVDNAMLTAMIDRDALLVTAHEVLKRRNNDGDAGLFNGVNREWPLGCVYYNDVDGSWAARVAMPLVSAVSVGEPFLVYLHHLHASLPFVRGFDLPRVALPHAANEATLRDVESLLPLQAALTHGADIRVQAVVMPGSVLVLRGRHHDARVVESTEVRRALTLANAGLTAAKLMLWPGRGQLYAEVAVPLAVCPLTQELLNWCLSHIAQTLEEARRIESFLGSA
jgi:hypothetical protein